MQIKFVWDPFKAKENVKKHRITFDEASTIFGSFPFEIFHDPDHSGDEERYVAIGYSNRGRALLVVHCENMTGTTIRLISARKATKKETHDVFGGEN